MTRRRKKHRPGEIVAKLRDADAMLNAGKDLAAVLQGRLNPVNNDPIWHAATMEEIASRTKANFGFLF
jgi:hypothetical protein